jgi:hypothetical protein
MKSIESASSGGIRLPFILGLIFKKGDLTLFLVSVMGDAH